MEKIGDKIAQSVSNELANLAKIMAQITRPSDPTNKKKTEEEPNSQNKEQEGDMEQGEDSQEYQSLPCAQGSYQAYQASQLSQASQKPRPSQSSQEEAIETNPKQTERSLRIYKFPERQNRGTRKPSQNMPE